MSKKVIGKMLYKFYLLPFTLKLYLCSDKPINLYSYGNQRFTFYSAYLWMSCVCV